MKDVLIGREYEMGRFNRAYQRDGGVLIGLYGRRRVGKTEFLKHFCKGKPSIFYPCSKRTNLMQLKYFSEALYSFSDVYSGLPPFTDWDIAFRFIGNLRSDEKIVIVIDEFPNMVKSNSEVTSILQNIWDHELRSANIMLILCGSSISLMEDQLLSLDGDLYDRFFLTYKMLPLPYIDVKKFLPDYSDEDLVIAYAITGGIPYYLEKLDSSMSIEENVKDKILSPGGELNNEVAYLMGQEFREIGIYNDIMESIAVGCNTTNKVCERLGKANNTLDIYIRKLIRIDYVESEYPIFAKAKENSALSKANLIIHDGFFRFWFRFVTPNIKELTDNDDNVDIIWDSYIKDNLHNFAASAFEDICIDYMRQMNRCNALPIHFGRIRRWWGNVNMPQEDGSIKNQSEEIDMVAKDTNRNIYIYGECKFKNEPFRFTQLQKLWTKLPRKEEIYYYLFSLRGFDSEVQQYAGPHLILVPLHDVFNPPQIVPVKSYDPEIENHDEDDDGNASEDED
ncbi:MAG: ATP-binding protein [Clostridia bacterium]|nr:ATP-binding protein [Clostridia bacterium]